MNTFIFSIFQEETFGVSLVLIPSQILTYKQQKKLPNAIQELFDKSLQNDSRFTRFSASSKLKIDSCLKNDQIMYEIIDNWNSANKSLREEENFKAFKRKIM